MGVGVGSKHHRSCITHHLPDDCWNLILEKLNSNLDQKSISLTCHRFLDIQNSSRKCLKLGRLCRFISLSDGISESFIINKLLNRFSQLEILCFDSCYDVSDSYLTLKYASKLHSLYLDYYYDVTDKGLESVASNCPFLSLISLTGCLCITDNGLEILTKSCKSLKEVNLSWCRRITDRGILSLVQNCRQLRALEIYNCDQIVGVSFQGCSPTLACLEADYCKFDSTGVSGILSGGGLEYLSLSYHTNCPSLGLEAIGLGFGSKLKILNFSMCPFVEDDVIVKISRGCPLLREWNLSYCIKIGISGWESIGSYCQNLETLHVSYCYNLCDRGLLALGTGCKRLSMIYMKECSRITESAIHIFKLQKKDVEIKYEVLWSIVPSWAFTKIS